MKKITQIPVLLSFSIITAVLLLAAGCKKKTDEIVASGPVPEVVTGNYTNVLLNTVQFAGNVSNDYGYVIKKRGFCWSNTHQTPTIQDDTVVAPGTNTASITDTIKRLKGQTTYYVRAYATNINGTGYGSAISVTTIDSTVSDIDNNHYRIVQIGNQIWMAENLKTTKLNDGTSIPVISNNTGWMELTTPGYCWYANDQTFISIYGFLYNWYCISTGKLAPIGWHVPSDDEWTTLTNFLGGVYVAGGKIKETGVVHWDVPNTAATNSTGFTALPGGTRSGTGDFSDNTFKSYFWSSTINPGDGGVWYRIIQYDSGILFRGPIIQTTGFSIRCIRD